MRTTTVAALVLLSSLSAYAQIVPAIEKIQADTNFRLSALQQFQGYEAKLTTQCETVDAAWGLARYKVYGHPQMAPDKNIVNATWVESVPGTPCGKARRYRVLVAIRSGKATVAALLPGESIASPQLEADAQAPLAAATHAFVPSGAKCPVDVLDTHLTGGPPADVKQAWSETWLIQTCGKRLNVPIEFVPDAVGPGTSIRIDSKAVHVAL